MATDDTEKALATDDTEKALATDDTEKALATDDTEKSDEHGSEKTMKLPKLEGIASRFMSQIWRRSRVRITSMIFHGLFLICVHPIFPCHPWPKLFYPHA